MPDTTIQALESGPYLVQGGATVTDADGTAYEAGGDAIALCRCGSSENKPFCDGTHTRIGFNADERASD